MFTFSRPSESTVIRYLIGLGDAPLSYQAVGATDGELPPGYHREHQRVLLGHGEACFSTAVDAVTNWKMFPTEMVTLYWPDRPIDSGVTVAVHAQLGVLHSLNPCRIVYTVDDRSSDDDVQRFGFAYGTLQGHLARGEERFLVEWDRTNDSVWYDLAVVWRPGHLLAWLGYPVIRLMQKRFRRLSALSMQQAVASDIKSLMTV